MRSSSYISILLQSHIFEMLHHELLLTGLGDYLPKYAGNLDIINCAAIAMAEEYAKNKFNEKK